MAKYGLLLRDGLNPQLSHNFEEIERLFIIGTESSDEDGNHTIDANLIVTGSITAQSTLSVSGASTLTGAITTGSTLTMGGNIYLGVYGIGNDEPVLTFASGASGLATFTGGVAVGTAG